MNKWWLIWVGLVFAPCAVAGNESVWARSYQLETARKYAESMQVLDTLRASGREVELLSLRRGWLAYQQGQHNDAISWYKQALQRNGKSMDATLGLTLPLLAQQRWREAAWYANKALELAPGDYTAYLRLIVAEEGMRDWGAMKKHAEVLSERYPSDASALVYLARAQVWLGDTGEARKTYGYVLSLSPGHAQATAYLNATRR